MLSRANAIKAFVILKMGHKATDKLKQDLKYHVRMTLGPIAQLEDIEFVDQLPKTRSGKIMRRVLKAKELGIDPGDISTLEDVQPGSQKELKNLQDTGGSGNKQ